MYLLDNNVQFKSYHKIKRYKNFKVKKTIAFLNNYSLTPIKWPPLGTEMGSARLKGLAA